MARNENNIQYNNITCSQIHKQGRHLISHRSKFEPGRQSICRCPLEQLPPKTRQLKSRRPFSIHLLLQPSRKLSPQSHPVYPKQSTCPSPPTHTRPKTSSIPFSLRITFCSQITTQLLPTSSLNANNVGLPFHQLNEFHLFLSCSVRAGSLRANEH